jgi:CRISPR-associated protein Cmr5
MVELRTHTVARVAYECVMARKEASCKKEYGALAHKLPGMILQNGLAQATGFLLAKGKDEHNALLADLAALLNQIGATTSQDGAALHNEIIAANLDKTLLLTRRSLEASGWIKRYVQGALKIDATGEHTDEEESA